MRLRDYLPRDILSRSMLMLLFPSICLFVALIWFYFESHISEVNRKLSQNVGRNISILVSSCESDDPAFAKQQLANTFDVETYCNTTGEPSLQDFSGSFSYRQVIERELENIVERDLDVQINTSSSTIAIKVTGTPAPHIFLIEKKNLLVANTHFLIVWGVLFLIAISLFTWGFMKQQVKSIVKLSRAAEAFGRGQDDFRFSPSGATEIRTAARALIQMRDRLKNFAEQRTTMLSGISHDLRTPLTRLKLTLAMMDQTEDVTAARTDLDDMQHMLDDYLDYARRDYVTPYEPFDLYQLISEMEILKHEKVSFPTPPLELIYSGRPSILKRAIENLISNGIKYGKQVSLIIEDSAKQVRILVDDDGPGIAEQNREMALTPFHRLDIARNQNVPGSGLGLSIANDAANSHGGSLKLGTSPMGGLRAELTLPK